MDQKNLAQPRRRFSSWAVALLLFVACAAVVAQQDTGMLAGRVVGPLGITIARARVELVSTDRNTKTVTRTTEEGLYLFPDVRPGHYEIFISAPGFKTVVLRSVTVYTQQALQENVSLSPGSPLEAISIQATAIPIATTGTVGTVVDDALVKELPLNGRSFQTLFQLTPGVIITPTTLFTDGQFSVNGQRTNSNSVTIDGLSANIGISAKIVPGQSAGGSLPALSAFGGTNNLALIDDVQEFVVLTSSYAPEFGRFPGGQVAVVTRSGSSHFHGGVYNYFRNDALDANDWFANRAGLQRAALRQNDYGGFLGGPVRRQKIFFFSSYEGLQLRQPTSIDADVPSIVARESAPQAVRPFLDAYPLPTGPDRSDGLASGKYVFSNPSTLDSASLRIDEHYSDSVVAFLRSFASRSTRQERAAVSNSPSSVTLTRVALWGLVAGLTYDTARFTGDTRLEVSRFSALQKDTLDSFAGAVPIPPNIVFPFPYGPSNSLFQFAPDISNQVRELSLGRNLYNVQRQINLVNNASYQLSTHDVKAGFDLRRLSPTTTPALYTQVSFFFDIPSTIENSQAASNVAAAVPVHSLFQDYSAYVQDAWTANQRLQLTYGLRWDYSPAPSAIGTNGSEPANVTGFGTDRVSLAQPGGPLYHVPLFNLAPRVGASYRLRDDCTISMGAGLFYDLASGPAGNSVSSFFFPFTSVKFLSGSSLPLAGANATPPALSPTPPFVSLQALPPLLRMPYLWQWNLTVRQSIGAAQTISVGYVGSSGHRLLRSEQYEGGTAEIPAEFTQIVFTSNGGYSNYHSLQVRFQSLGRAGLHLIGSYVLSHSTDNVSSDAGFSAIPARLASPARDYGSSDFDIRHAASLGAHYQLASVHGLSSILFSGWSIDSVLSIRSAPPVDVVVVREVANGLYNFRPDLLSDVRPYIADPDAPGGRRINTSALMVPDIARQGTLPRNFFRGFALAELNLAIVRRFHVSKQLSVQFRAEAFNAFNHPNFSAPSGLLARVAAPGNTITESTFGIAQTTFAHGGSIGNGFSSLYQIGGARSLQLAARMEF